MKLLALRERKSILKINDSCNKRTLVPTNSMPVSPSSSISLGVHLLWVGHLTDDVKFDKDSPLKKRFLEEINSENIVDTFYSHNCWCKTYLATFLNWLLNNP